MVGCWVELVIMTIILLGCLILLLANWEKMKFASKIICTCCIAALAFNVYGAFLNIENQQSIRQIEQRTERMEKEIKHLERLQKNSNRNYDDKNLNNHSEKILRDFFKENGLDDSQTYFATKNLTFTGGRPCQNIHK